MKRNIFIVGWKLVRKGKVLEAEIFDLFLSI
jgi:hypothetical protein